MALHISRLCACAARSFRKRHRPQESSVREQQRGLDNVRHIQQLRRPCRNSKNPIPRSKVILLLNSPVKVRMPTVAIVTKPNKPEITEVLSGVIEWLEKHGYDVVLDPASAAYAHGHREVEREQLYKYKPEFVVVLGGDGTLLAAARAVAHAGIPLLAVNL